MPDTASTPKPASAATTAANAAVAPRVAADDRADFERATRGRLAQLDPPTVDGIGGRAVWDVDRFAFATGDAPPSVHPSLWRQAQLNNVHGLFEVTDGIYQVRGYDISNVTFVRSGRG